MQTKQVLVDNDKEKILKPDLQYTVKIVPTVIDTEKEITVNECNAAEKIERYPEVIQKLVWRALYYKSEIIARRSTPPRTSEDYTKLTKYIEAFRSAKQLIMVMCKKYNLGFIIIEGDF